MAALALCGTAFAWEGSTSQLKATELANFNNSVYNGESITLTVNTNADFGNFDVRYSFGTVTLNFVSSNAITASTALRVGGAEGYTITGDSAALNYWGEKLTSSTDLTYIPLATTAAAVNVPAVSAVPSIVFVGTIPTMTYTEYMRAPSQGDLEAIGHNEFALVGFTANSADHQKGLYLVGRGGATTPEPATATLSLMALAGLCARRRRK